MNKSNLLKNIFAIGLSLTMLGAFVMPAKAQAFNISSILNSVGLGTSSYGGSYSSYYNSYNSLYGQNNGNIKISKQVRDTSKNSSLHSSITVRSGALVEVVIVVQNTSSKVDGDVYVNDEIGGSSVFVDQSLTVNGTPTAGSLSYSNVRVHLPRKTEAKIIYYIHVCSDSGYVTHASAYSPGLGSATDATSIYTERFNGYSDNFVGTCYQTFSTPAYSNSPSTTGGTYTSNSSNPFGTWTGVNNLNTQTPATTTQTTTSSNPFGDWTGVNNLNSSTNFPSNTSNSNTTNSVNPFGDWTGVNNSTNTTSQTNNNPFGGWTGVNSNTSSTDPYNPFAGWTGVNNSNSTGTSANPFGEWHGVNNSGNTNPFGDWTGVNSAGYSTASTTYAANTSNQNYSNTSSNTYRVAPTTGVDKWAPIWFASLVTMLFLAYRKRKLLFN